MRDVPKITGQVTLPDLEHELGYSAIKHLSPANELFCQEYILNGANAPLAYQIANPKSSGKSAMANSYRLLKTEKIQQRIIELQEELQRRYAVETQAVVRLLSMSMSVDRRQFVDLETGEPLDLHLLPPEAASITDIEFVLDRHGTKHVLPVVVTRTKAAEALAKVMGLTNERVEISDNRRIDSNIRFYIPDNGRDKLQNAADLLTMDQLRAEFARHKEGRD
jgi:phage terminase small subunit